MKTKGIEVYGDLYLVPMDDGSTQAASIVDKTVYQYCIDRCTYINGILSANPYHPEEEEWFAEGLESVAKCWGYELSDLISMLCSEDPRKRASAYDTIGAYHGYENLDQYPVALNDFTKYFDI